VAGDLVEQLDRGDQRALPRLLTLVENDDPRGLAALEQLYPRTGRAHVVGITGPPGSGKSTLVAALVAGLRKRSERVAVLAIDPSSPVSGGAVLGDRIRMMERHADPGVFVRSMAARGRLGGLAPTAARAVHLLDAAGYSTILVETVGTGQDGISVADLAHTVAVVQVPGLGDGVQSIKAGLLEIGDLLVVNKLDLPGAREVVRLLRLDVAAQHQPDGWDTPVVGVSATSGDGIEDVLEAIEAHHRHLKATAGWGDRTRRAAVAEILGGVRQELDRRFREVGSSDDLGTLVADVANRRSSPEMAIAALLDRLGGALGGGDPVGDQRRG
jgi:LAO/AO transport system kinase